MLAYNMGVTNLKELKMLVCKADMALRLIAEKRKDLRMDEAVELVEDIFGEAAVRLNEKYNTELFTPYEITMSFEDLDDLYYTITGESLA